MYGSEVIDILPFSDKSGIFGVAIDIGTTTRSLSGGSQVGRDSCCSICPKSPVSYGQDVISRIDYTIKRAEGIDELRAAVLPH